MTFGMRHLGRSIRLVSRSLVAALLLAALVGATAQPQPDMPKSLPQGAQAGEQSMATREVRLRKLHLVRPDLIPYPVCYEIYC